MEKDAFLDPDGVDAASTSGLTLTYPSSWVWHTLPPLCKIIFIVSNWLLEF